MALRDCWRGHGAGGTAIHGSQGHEAVRALLPKVALLPVNGHDAERISNRTAGNFTLDEASQLGIVTEIPTLILRRFGLFAFNTADPAEIDVAAGRNRHPRLLRPEARHLFRLS